MKHLFTIFFLLIVQACFAQEPTPFGINFRIVNKKGKPLNSVDLKKSDIQVYFTSADNQYRQCDKNPVYTGQPIEFTYDTLRNYFSFERLYSPSESCEPSFVIIQGTDTMFIRLRNVLNYSCYKYLPNGSGHNLKRKGSRFFTIRFRKGYYHDYTPVDSKEENRFADYFKNELDHKFCYWVKVK